MIVTKSININDLIEQGTITNSGDDNSDIRIRNNGRINIILWEKTTIFISAMAVNGKQLQCDMLGYDSFSSNSPIFDLYWFDTPHGFDVSSYTTLTNIRIVIRYADNSQITPQDLLSVSISYEIDIVWRMGTNCPTQDAFPVIPDAIVSPSPNSIFLIKDGVLYQKGFPELPDKALKKPYPNSAWRIQRGYNDWYPFHETMPLIDYNPPTPDPYNNTKYHNYQIYADNLLIFDTRSPMDELKLIDPQLHLEDNSAGSLEFTIPYTNVGYDETITQPMKTEIFVYEDGEEIWSGRILTEDRDFYNRRKLYCEGELAYLNDTCQPQRQYNELTLRQFLEAILDIHNSKVDENKAFYVGAITVTETEPLQYRYTQYQKTMEVINDLVDSYGGHLRIRKVDGRRYLDWLKDYPRTCDQRIRFGENLVDFTKSFDFSELATVLVPLGERLDTGERSDVGDLINPILVYPHSYIEPNATQPYEDYDIYDNSNPNYRVDKYEVEVGESYYITTRMNDGHGMWVLKDEDNIVISHKNANDDVDMTDIIEEKITIPEGGKYLYVGGFIKHVEIRVNSVKDLPPELDEYTTVESVNGGSIYVVNDDTRKTYGWLEKQITFEGVTDPAKLLEMANDYLTNGQFDGMSMEVSAFDLKILEANVDKIQLLDEVYVESPPHGLYSKFPVSELNIPLDSPNDAKFTLGKEGTKTLTGVNNNTNDELLKEIMRIPSVSSVLQSAIDNSTQLITSATNGYVTIKKGTYDTEHHQWIAEDEVGEILITDTPNYLEATKVWRWNINGFGYSNTGYNGNYRAAITMNGQIVADFIAAGTMLADRIHGGKLKLGGISDASGVLEVIANDGNTVVCKVNHEGIMTNNISGTVWNRIAGGSFISGRYENGSAVEFGGMYAASRITYDGNNLKGIELFVNDNGALVFTGEHVFVRDSLNDTIIHTEDGQTFRIVSGIDYDPNDGTINHVEYKQMTVKNGFVVSVVDV